MSDNDAMISVELNVDRTPVRFTAEQFALMTKAGVFASAGGKAELVRGVHYSGQTRFAPHARNEDELAFVLDSIFGDAGEYCFGRAARVRLSATSVAQPDLAILRRAEATGHGADVLPASALALAIEIEIEIVASGAATAARADDYAAAGVPALWIIETGAGLVHTYGSPGASGYGARHAVRFGDPIALKPIADVEIVIPHGGFA